MSERKRENPSGNMPFYISCCAKCKGTTDEVHILFKLKLLKNVSHKSCIIVLVSSTQPWAHYLEFYGDWHHLLALKLCQLVSVLRQVLATLRHTVQTSESPQYNETALHIHPVAKWWQRIIKLQLHFKKLGICKKKSKLLSIILRGFFINMVKTKRISLQVAKVSCFPTVTIII